MPINGSLEKRYFSVKVFACKSIPHFVVSVVILFYNISFWYIMRHKTISPRGEMRNYIIFSTSTKNDTLVIGKRFFHQSVMISWYSLMQFWPDVSSYFQKKKKKFRVEVCSSFWSRSDTSIIFIVLRDVARFLVQHLVQEWAENFRNYDVAVF